MIEGPGAMEALCARRAESADAHHLEALVSASTEQLFGRVVPVSLIENANLAVTLCNDTNEIIAHSAFLDYPNTACVDQAEWLSWIHKHYDSSMCTPMNTLFMHYFVAKSDVETDCAKQIIRTVFKAAPDLHFVLLLLKNASPGAALENIFTKMKTHGDMADPAGSLYVCHRHDHFPILHIRQAREEDHDDLLPIFSRQSQQLCKTYGEFFLAELIEAQDQNNHTAVAEVNGVGVGFMSVHSEVDIALLNDFFELIPFHGLCKAHPEDITQPNLETSKQCESDAEMPEQHKGDISPASGASHVSLPSEQSQISQPPEVRDKENHGGSQSVDAVSSLASDGEADSNISNNDTSKAQQAESIVNAGSKTMILTPPSKVDVVVSETLDFRPVYKGASNAFCIQLFCIDEKYEMRSQDFLPYVFNLFPDKDYCIMTVPHLLPEFPLLHSFMRVTPRYISGFSQELYIVHRSALYKSMVVRAARSSDSDAVKSLVGTLIQHKLLLADLKQFNLARRDPNGTKMHVYVAEILEKIIGVAIVHTEEDIEYIRSHYNIEDFIYYSHHRRDQHAHLCHFVLNPAFYLYTTYFLKEILRLSHYTCLYYPVYPEYSQKNCTEKHHTLSSALHCLVPVRPRRQIWYPLPELGENSPSERVLMEQEMFALNHFNRKLTLEPKVTVNARVVVVGASDTGISFLETFAFCPHLRFNNLTLISTHGLPGELPPCPIREGFLASSHCYSTKGLAMLSLHSRIAVVVGKMVAINRSAKHVVVTGGGHVSYDYLILCTGQQYEVPCPTAADLSNLPTNSEVPNSPDRRYSGPIPANLFTLNDEHDCQHALEWLRRNFLCGQGNAIVYGSSLDAYTTVQTLLKLGVAGSRIHVAEPPRGYTVSCFNNFALESAIRGVLLEAGVKVYASCLLAHWNENTQQRELITSASFTTDTKPFSLECSVFFGFSRKGVDYEAFRAANDSCLVFDSRLVIDASFCTSDSAIRAAGTLTKYARRYYADYATHAGYNSKEVGFHLAAGLLPFLDPTLEPPSNDANPSVSLDRLVPTFTAPNIQGGILPGGYHYLHIAKPGVVIPLEAQMARPDYGRELVTGCPEQADYFRLHVGCYGTVETLTCLSAKPLPSSNYICLYGQHEQLLNTLLSRIDEGLVPDLYSYFRQPWCMAIFHDRFQDLQREHRQLMSTAQVETAPSMMELATQLVQGDVSLLDGGPQSLDEQFKKLGYKKALETRLVSYLQYNHYHLPMYFRPGLI